MSDDFTKFRKLLEETYLFPANYTHKFIGKNSDLFRNSVIAFEGKFVGLKRIGEKQSANAAHVALTYEYIAASAEDIIGLAKATYQIDDLIYIL